MIKHKSIWKQLEEHDKRINSFLRRQEIRRQNPEKEKARIENIKKKLEEKRRNGNGKVPVM